MGKAPLLLFLLRVLLLASGLAMLLGGGACVAILAPAALQPHGGDGLIPVLLVALMVAAGGLILVWAMVHAFRRGRAPGDDGARLRER